jgi:hypothetical protein
MGWKLKMILAATVAAILWASQASQASAGEVDTRRVGL